MAHLPYITNLQQLLYIIIYVNIILFITVLIYYYYYYLDVNWWMNLRKKVEFLKGLKIELQLLLKHDYIAKSQANYLEGAKNTLEEGEFIVTLDFSENYSFVIQDSVLAYHWSNEAVTIHPYVIYYKKENKICHHNFVIISEANKHDSTAVNIFNKKMIDYLHQNHGKGKVKKLFFF